MAAAREAFAGVEQPLVAGAGGGVRLIPEYDAYILGFRERDELVPPEVREQVAAHGKGKYEGPAGTPFLLIDGLCAGIWQRRKTGRQATITVQPARRLTRSERSGVEAEADRIGHFLGVPVLLDVVGR